ncbi:ABC transporter ATP-binding protein [Mesorhizobium camelthorni]|uniref:ABC transporter ATP-binding protein n=1 Tax=Allomesorhizobium camelthorni TaxID=475069 RepID=A0A6G4WN09_9HYPH|nr:ABC transporter ATP-binding protein [Mesorhizobium camelthorni]
MSKSFGALRVVDDVSFDLADGEALGILGPNGAGKTTLFNLISGDTAHDAGSITLAGGRLDGVPAFRRAGLGIGRTYQIPRPYAKMTTFENLLVASRFAAGRSEHEAFSTCAQLLEECGLDGRANRAAGSLTLLDRKRLELARALAGEPKLLLLDEIAGGLTDAESEQLVALVRRVRERGVTIIWIEHVLHAVMAVAERLMVLSFGQKIAEGRPDQVINDPEVRRVYLGIDA